MTAALEQAVQKMNTLQAKKSTLLRRLDELEKGFEEASIDKTDQERKTSETMSQLEYLSSLAEILQMEHNKYSVVSSSLPERFTGLLGSTAMAAGLLTYLGPYEYLFRRLILSVEWPLCLKERGLPFLIDSVDPIQRRLTDFSIEFFKGDSEETKETDVIADCNQDQEDQNQQGVKQEDPAVTQPEVDVCSDYGSSPQDLTAPVITEEHYPDFIKALLKLIVGHKQVQEWIAKDWTLHQMQNAAVLFTSWQKPPLLIDSSDETEKWLKELHSASTISVKLGERPESSVLLNIEKALQSGSSLLLYNYTNKWDDLIRPLIEHCNTATGRNLQLDQFRLYIAMSQTEGWFRTDINCGTTLINYREGEDTLRDVLLHRMFSNTQPNLQGQLKKVARTILDAQDSLRQLEIRFRECINSSPQNSDGIADIFNDKNQLSERLQESQSLYSSLSQLRDKLLPVAHRGALLYSILQALRVLAREYQFPLSYFLCLFDKAIGNSALEEDSLQVEDAPEARTGLDLETEEEGIKARQHRNPLHGKDLVDSRIDGSLTDPEPPAESLSTQFESMEVIRSPQEPAILSPGTKEHSFSANQISQLVDQLTETVYQAINQSLYPEHSLVFSAMLTLYIQLQSGGSLSEEELALLFQGFQSCGSVALTLNDFGSDADPPAWLPPERWEGLLGLSVLPGPLDSVCVQVAESSTEWETWYNSDHPELETPPLAAQGFTVENVDDAPGSSGIPGLASEFQKLLVLHTLRPDCLTGALSLYIKRQKNSSVQARRYPTVSDIADLAVDSLGILVLLPSGLSHAKGPSNVCLARSVQHATVVCIAAKERSIPVSVADIKEDFQGYIETALDDMVEQDGWLILENLHLASSDFISSLYEKLIRGRKEQNKKRQFRVWLTSELGAPFPHQFISELHKSHLITFVYCAIRKTNSSPAIVSALNQIRNEPCGESRSLPMIVRCLCFGVCVLHGMMEALQFLPVSGLSQVYPVSYTQLQQAIDVIISSGQHLQSSSESSVQILTKKIATIYTNLVTNPEDALYVQSLATEILPQCLQSKVLGDAKLLALAVYPRGYSLITVHNSVELLRSLSEVYKALQCGLPPADQEDSITPTGLLASRLAAGFISEQLPLEPDASSPFEPFPSVPGTTKEEDTEEFEAVRHALLQECSWLNRSLRHIRQQVSGLEKSLLTDTLALPDLAEVAESLKKDEVPGSWLHPYCQPSTHTLSTWIQDLKKRHSQWVEEGMVHHGEKTAGNRIESVWLGGLLNPEGLIMALQHAYAAANGCLLDEIALSCHISKSPEHTAQPESQQCQLILEGLVLHGASWDFKANQIGEPRDKFVPLPYVTVRPVLRTAEMSEDRAKLFECPVYRNTTRQPSTLSNEYYHNYYVTQPAIELSQQTFFQQPQPVYHSLPDQKTLLYQVPQDHLQPGVYYQSTTRQPAEAPVYLRPYQEQNRSSNIPMVFQIQGEQYIHYQVQGRKTKKRHSKNHIQEVGDLTYVGLNSVANHLPGITTSALLPGVTKAAKPDSQVPTQMITANHQAEGVYHLSNEKITKFLRIDGQPTKLCHSQTPAGESASILAFVKGMTVEPKLEERSFNEICQNISHFPHAAKKEEAGANQKVEGSGNEIVQKVKLKQVACEVAPITGGMTIFSRAAELVKLSNTPGDLLVRTMASPTDTEGKHDQELGREVNVLKGNTEESHAIWASEDLTLPDNLLEALFKIPSVLDLAVEMGYLPDVNSYCLVDPQLPGRSVSLGGTCMKVAVNKPNPSNFPNVQ
ncbi:UNVERIFIED_CONTAM: hypothetical protein FKN15_050184 [Acipenser sinensis]